MIKLVATIKERAETHHCYSRPMADPRTNQPVLDKEGNPKSFIPSFLQSNNRVKSSPNFNDNPDIVAAIEAASKTWEAKKIAMSAHSKLIAQLEIQKRIKVLQAKFFSLATTFALGLIVVEQTKNGGPNAASTLNRKELLQKATYDALRDFPTETLLLLSFNSTEALLTAFSTTNVYDNAAIESKMVESDSDLIKPLITRLIEWLPLLSTDVWAQTLKTDQERKINAELRKALAPKAAAKANADVEMALDRAHAENSDTRLFIRKTAEAAAKVTVQQIV
jgi:hypothetical protein